MTEGGEIAITRNCPHLHINEDWVIIEPVDENRQPMQDSEVFSAGILVTDLSNFVQPIIRYYVSDSVRIRKERFDCCPLPVMEIRGRSWESFHIGGKSFTTKGLEVKAKFCKGLCQYQFLQTSDNSMEVRGVVAAGYDTEKVLGGLAELLTAYFAEAGCEKAVVTYSEKPLLHNEKGGKTPLYKNVRE